MKRKKISHIREFSQKIIVVPHPRDKTKGLLHFQNRTYPCALGRSGTTMLKHEGDGATPIGCFPILYGFARFDRIKSYQSTIKLHQINKSMGWCDDLNDRNYNRLIKRPYPTSHEEMKRKDHLYDICIVLDYNITQRIKGRGSAIFFHQARENYSPTEGCIAVSPHHMRQILPKLTNETKMIIQR